MEERRQSVLSEDTVGKNRENMTPPLLSSPSLPGRCHGGGSQQADKQTVYDKASGRLVARGTRPF